MQSLYITGFSVADLAFTERRGHAVHSVQQLGGGGVRYFSLKIWRDAAKN